MEAVVQYTPHPQVPQPVPSGAANAGWRQRLARWWPFAGKSAEPAAGLDPSTGLLTAETLFGRSDALLKPGAGPVAVALFELSDLREVREIYGNTVRRAIIQQWVRRLRAAAGGRGLVARTGPEQFLLVLPGSDAEQAAAALARNLGSPPRLEFDPRGLELVLVPDVLVQAIEAGERSMAAVLGRMAGALEAQREAERRRQHYLELERARHSRPMPLRPLARRR